MKMTFEEFEKLDVNTQAGIDEKDKRDALIDGFEKTRHFWGDEITDRVIKEIKDKPF